MRFSVFVAVTGCALLAAGSAYAADKSDTAAKDMDPIVCKSMAPRTGTRLGGRHICMKESEWKARAQHDRDALSKWQDKSGFQGPTSTGTGH